MGKIDNLWENKLEIPHFDFIKTSLCHVWFKLSCAVNHLLEDKLKS